MNYEEKYNQALERARKLATDLPNGRADRLYHVSDLEAIFPELKDNEGRIAVCIRMCLTDANEQRFKEYNTTLKDCLAWLEKQSEKSWREEDEKIYSLIYSAIKNDTQIASPSNKKDAIDWLKSLKDRVQPQPQNIAHYNPYKEVVESIAEMCKHYDRLDVGSLQDFYDNVKVKCKDAKEYDSLFPQNRWKPSDEQMEAIKFCCANFEEYDALKSLYNDLKGLNLC